MLSEITGKDLDTAFQILNPGKRRNQLTKEEKEWLFLGAMLMKCFRQEDEEERIRQARLQGQSG